jgi:branched-chain amino acid transport system substrate-binding protein
VADRSATLVAIDSRQGRLAAVVATGGAPRDVAAGLGAVWTIDERRRALVEISPDYLKVVRRFALRTAHPPASIPGVDSFDPWGVAVGGGAVWVTDGSRVLMRVDPRRDRVTRIPLGAPLDGVTFARHTAWVISGARATVIAVRARPFRIALVSRPGFQSPYPIAIEHGLGALWVLNGNTATVTRIDPTQRGVTATIPIGVDHSPERLAVGGRAVWVAGADGTLTRIDADTKAPRTWRLARGLGDVAVAEGRVWVSAGNGYAAPAESYRSAAPARSLGGVRALPGAQCSPLYYRPGDRPRLLVASDLPLQGNSAAEGLQMNAAILMALRDRGFRAGAYPVAFQACDDSTPATVTTDERRCEANAQAYARDASVVGVIGTFTSTCATFELPILNRAGVAMVSPSNTYVGLTRAGPGAEPGDPARFAPTGRRSYARVMAPDDVQGAADAVLAHDLHARRVFVVSDGSPYGRGIATAFRRAARRLGIQVAGSARWDRTPPRALRPPRADAAFLGGYPATGGGDAVIALRHRLPAGAPVIVPDGFFDARNLAHIGRAGEGMLLSIAGLPLDRLGERGERFASRLASAIGTRPYTYSVYAAQAAELMLDAIGRSDGTRASVVRNVLSARVDGGILGSFAITPTGDTTSRVVSIYRVSHGRPTEWRTIEPPASLVAPGDAAAGAPVGAGRR